jgi:hypothetical protein
MANMGDLQRAMHEAGAAKARLETVGRLLRGERVIGVAGHGPHAKAVSAEETAAFIIACLGSSKATFALDRLAILSGLRGDRTGATLRDSICALLSSDEVTVDELRISRRSDIAWLRARDGETETFAAPNGDERVDLIRTEGVITGAALEQLRALINGPSPSRRRAQRKRAKGRGGR